MRYQTKNAIKFAVVEKSELGVLRRFANDFNDKNIEHLMAQIILVT